MLDLTKQKFGRLAVIKLVGKDRWGSSKWLCMCDCGKTKIVYSSNLKSGATKSCGCLHKERLAARVTKHGHAKIGRKSKPTRKRKKSNNNGDNNGSI